TTLYISDYGNARIRALDVSMSNGNILTYAGGGDPSQLYPYGDGGPANRATLSAPMELSFGPDGALYFFDTGHTALRRVDPATNEISTVFFVGGQPGGINCYSSTITFDGCGTDSCAMAWDPAGNLFFTSYLCGNGSGLGYGIVRRAPDGTLTAIAGGGTGIPG